jgi:hypothetical protein
MNLLRSSKDQLVFQLGHREKDLLLAVLTLYPRIPAAHQPLSKSNAVPDTEAIRLLEEALAEQRAENQKCLRALLEDPQRLAKNDAGWRLSLSSTQLESLLQVLNDIRLGSWVLLGSPEEPFKKITQKTVPHLWGMEMAGSFQMRILEILDGES